MDYEVVEEIIYGLESGIMFGYDSWYTIFVHKSEILKKMGLELRPLHYQNK